MIRGVDREIRKAVKDAARAEGIRVGTPGAPLPGPRT
jgi:hypothetical protein